MDMSINFIRERIKTGHCSNLNIEDFNNMVEMNFRDAFKTFMGKEISYLFSDNEATGNRATLTSFGEHNDIQGNRQIDIIYNPDDDFEYFTMESCICDGTLIFVGELVTTLIEKLMNGSTYNIETAPRDYFDNFWDYDIVYTVGNFVSNSQIDKSAAPSDKPWMTDVFTVMLPIKCEFINNKKERKR